MFPHNCTKTKLYSKNLAIKQVHDTFTDLDIFVLLESLKYNGDNLAVS